MIKEMLFKGERAVELQGEHLRVVVLPRIGGKIASIYHRDKDFELLFQNKADSYLKASFGEPFENYDASGFDDCFPTIDSSIVQVEGKEILYPDHGEIWSSNFSYEIKEEELILRVESRLLPYTYRKSLSLQEDGLFISYAIENKGKEAFPAIWAMHCLVNCEEDMRINFPEGTEAIENVHESGFLGKVGKILEYPIDNDIKGNLFDFRTIGSKDDNNCEKYYHYQEVQRGLCSIYYPSKELIFEVSYDKEKLPYLGFWVTEGGFRGDYNCALEPCTGYYDGIDIAMDKGRCPIIIPGEILEFSINLSLK